MKSVKKLLFLSLGLVCSSNLSCFADSFDFELFKTLAKSKPHSNMLISPISISTALSMTAVGASGQTYDSILKVLSSGTTAIDIAKTSAERIKSLTSAGNGTTVALANNLYGGTRIHFKEDFTNNLKQNFNVSPMTLNFASPEAVKQINSFVKTRTKDMIPSIVDKINPLTTLILVNAIYFKGGWEHNFNSTETKPKTFKVSSENSVQVPMMTAERKDLRYFDNDLFQALRLPYKDGRMSLMIFLPAADKDLQTVEDTLDQKNWLAWQKQFNQRPGKITLPKFKIQDSMSLKPTLKTLGMSMAFDPEYADFTKMIKEKRIPNMCIGDILHKTLIEVNEEGTEASASTAVFMDRKSLFAPEPYFEMKVNRPFLFALHDQEKDCIIFMGHVNDPSPNNSALSVEGGKK